ncbi:hypothetical protein BHM03_00019644 [Ensete ventricosum]|nr:hypothetical protein BHM03_00019644 [Ensete ventricosum]
MTRSIDNPPHFSPESDQAPLGDITKRPEPAPSASARNFLDPDKLSSDSTGSLREQLCLVNQRIDDVRKTLRTKDEHAEGPLCGSPFVQEIQDAHIPSHFRLPMLEVYDDNSDPTELVAMFYVQMTLYGTSDAIMYHKRPRGEPSRGPLSRLPKRRIERGEQTVPRPPNISLNSTRIEIFLQIREKGLLKTPNPLRSRAEDRDRRRYCSFHRDYGHDTEECYDLKNQIGDLIHRGHLTDT